MSSGASGAEKRGLSSKSSFWYHFFSIKLHFLLRLEIDWWILRCCQSTISSKFRQYAAYRQYFLINSATLFSARSVKPTLLLRLWLFSRNSLYCFLQRAALLLREVVRNIQTTRQSSHETGRWHSMRSQVLRGKQMAACEQGRVFSLQWPRFAQNSMIYTSSSHWSILFQLWFKCCEISTLVIDRQLQ